MATAGGEALDGRTEALKGLACLLLAFSLMPVMDGTAKHLANLGYPVTQTVWARFVFSAVIAVPLALAHHGRDAVSVDAIKVQGVRAAFLLAATYCFFGAISTIPIANALAIYFAYPFVMTALSPWLLKETAGWRRWAATGVGFLGTLLIIRPDLEVEPGAVLALAGAGAFAFYLIATRHLATRRPAWVTLAWQAVLGGVAASFALPFGWKTPDLAGWALLFQIGALATVSHFFLIKGYARLPAPVLAPLGYVEIVGAVAVGYLWFGDFPAPTTWAGIAIIVTSGAFVSYREAVRRER